MIIEESYDKFVSDSNYISDGNDYDEQLVGTILVRDSGVVSYIILLIFIIIFFIKLTYNVVKYIVILINNL